MTSQYLPQARVCYLKCIVFRFPPAHMTIVLFVICSCQLDLDLLLLFLLLSFLQGLTTSDTFFCVFLLYQPFNVKKKRRSNISVSVCYFRSVVQ